LTIEDSLENSSFLRPRRLVLGYSLTPTLKRPDNHSIQPTTERERERERKTKRQREGLDRNIYRDTDIADNRWIGDIEPI
jgi:hypothetical protein